MHLLFLILLSSYGVYSLPLQENCTESEAAFHVCLSKLSSELPDPDNITNFEITKSVFIQCGAKLSDCYLQKTLMMMINSLTPEKKEPEFDKTYTASYPPYELRKESRIHCKQWFYNEDGFLSDMHEASDEYYTCRLEFAKSKNISAEIIKNLEDSMYSNRRKYFKRILSLFTLYVKQNGSTIGEKLLSHQTGQEDCKESEEAFRACFRDSNRPYINDEGRKNAILQCGADKSDCYLQKHFMKMLNTVLVRRSQGGTIPFTDDYIKCIKKVDQYDSKWFECARDGFDQHGFPREDGEFQFLAYSCKAERAKTEPEFCNQGCVDMLMRRAFVFYNSAINRFVGGSLRSAFI